MKKLGKFRINLAALSPRLKFREGAATLRQIYKADVNIIVFIAYGLLYDAVMNLYKPFALKFLDRVGGTDFHISLYNSLPGLAAVVAIIPGSLFINRFARKKRVTTVFFAFSRAFILMLVFLPFLPLAAQPLTFVALVSAMNFFDAIGQNSMQGMLGSVFGGTARARAISLRNKFGNICVTLVTLVTGIIITYVPKTDEQRVVVYQVFFALSFAISIIEIFAFNKFREKPSAKSMGAPCAPLTADPDTPFKMVAFTFKDAKFRRFLALSLFMYFAWHMGWPLGGIMQIKELGANEMWLAALAVTSGFAAFLAAGYWGKFINKKGNYMALAWGAVGISGNMFFYTVCYNLPLMLLINMWGGAVSIGVTIALLNGLLQATPDENRVVFIGVYNTFVNLSLAVSPFVMLFFARLTTVRTAAFIIGTVRLVAALLLYLEHRRQRKAANAATETPV